MTQQESFVRRRFFIIYLPIIATGAVLYLATSATTLTVNAGTVLGVGLLGLGVFGAAWDAGDRS